MFRALKLMTLDRLCLYFNTVPLYLDQSIRNTQPVAPDSQYDRKRFSSLSSKVRPRFLITLTLSFFLMLNFERRSCHILADTDL
jgi:hypothetical protein